MEPKIEDIAQKLREDSKALEDRIRGLMNSAEFQGEQARANQHSEMKANIMLAVRRQEDVRMRLGKVCQHAADGVSCYDK